MRIKEILRITGGKLWSGKANADIDLTKVSTDSRTIRKGEFFLALSGPNFCGSDFTEDAFRKGALGAIVERCVPGVKDTRRTIIKVRDATKTLQDIAAYHRTKFDIPVICVTGSNGKTTVKDMIWTVLSAKYNVLRNEGTKNNHIGVPQTLLKLSANHDTCVLELGTNHRGEIKMLADIARPTVAVITNIGPSHLEFLSDLKGVFDEKKDVLKALDKGMAFAVLNGDDKFLSRIKGEGLRTIKYGLEESNDLAADILEVKKNRIRFLVNGKGEFQLNLLGVHNVPNALAAIATGSLFGVGFRSMRESLLDYRPTCMRLEPVKIKGMDVINDAYNSNPLSLTTALEAIRDYPAASKWVVSGDMLELGRYGVRFHKMAGEMIAGTAAKGLVTFGNLSKYTLSQAQKSGMNIRNLWHCATHDEIADTLKKVAKRGDLILIKGSRSMKMEKVVEKLRVSP